MKTDETPKLAPPGAGLPLPQRIILKFIVGPFISKQIPRPACRAHYERITQKVIDRVEAVPLERRHQKVLVNPIVGLEDSSRYWSINETLEHIMIVSKGIEGIILSLSSGVVPNQVVDTAKVKPRGGGEDRLIEFKDYAPGLMARIDEKLAKPGMNIDNGLRLAHPWFGKITAHQWYWLLSRHQSIHSQQLKQIIGGLKA